MELEPEFSGVLHLEAELDCGTGPLPGALRFRELWSGGILRVNGQRTGIRAFAPWVFRLDPLHAGKNLLELEFFGYKRGAFTGAVQDKKGKLERVARGSRDLKMVVLGDKLSNIRSIARDYLSLGEKLWDRFNEKRRDVQAWYYWGMADCLAELASCEPYQEYVGLCRQVFGERDPRWGEK